jgi:hypothetical protein
MKSIPVSLFAPKINNLITLRVTVLLALLFFTSQGYGQHASTQKSGELNIQAIKEVLEIKGTENDDEYKVTVPQNDLNVEVDGFKIIPPMGLGSWTAFTAAKGGGRHAYGRHCSWRGGDRPGAAGSD